MQRIFSMIGILILLFIVSLFFLYWFERVNLINTNIATRLLDSVFLREEPEQSEAIADALLLEALRIDKRSEELNLRESEISKREAELKQKEDDLIRREAQTVILEEEIDEAKKSLNQQQRLFENRSIVINYNAQTLLNMPPQQAVDILQGYEDQTLIDTLVATDRISDENGQVSVVPLWLSLMSPKRAATIQEKLLARQ